MDMRNRMLRKRPRNHPAIQDKKMRVDGFTEFSQLAFNNGLEKSAAPLSKRRNGIGPSRALGTLPIIQGNLPWSERISLIEGALLFVGVWYFTKLY